MRSDSVFAMCKEVMKQPLHASQDNNNLPEMTSSLGDDLEKELNGLLDSRECALSCRLKVYFLGDRNSGKTSLVQSIVGETACLSSSPSESTTHRIWRPLRKPDSNVVLQRRPSLDERSLTLELWDMPGRKVCQGIHQMFLSRALYVLVFNLVDSESCLQLPKYISYVQAKIPGCPMLIVATRADKLFTSDERAQKAEETLAGVRAAQQAEVDAIKNDITQISDLGADPKLLNQLEWLETLLQKRPKLRAPIHVVSCKTGKGLPELRRELVHVALDCQLFPHTGELLSQEQVRLCELLDDQRARGKVLLTWPELRDVALEAVLLDSDKNIRDEKPSLLTEDVLKRNLVLLEQMGTLCSFPGLTPPLGQKVPTQYICVAPQKLGALLCCYHVDNPRKTFHIEARRFWPEANQKPDSATLVKLLEEIPHQGVIREVLCPLLWQEAFLEEEQIHRVLDLLVTSGLFTHHTASLDDVRATPTQTETNYQMSIYQYPNLTQNRKYHANLMGLMPDKRPMLNWSPKPFKGDIQVTWRYTFPCGSPPGLTQRMLGACRQTAVNNFYLHQWRYGLLVKMDDAVVCVELDTVDLYADVSCRVNADDPTDEDDAVKFLWAHLAPYIRATLHFLRQWPGLVYRLEILPFGSVFYKGETIGGEHAFLVGQCFMSAQNEVPVTFNEGGVERSMDGALLLQLDWREHRTLDEWLTDVLSTRQVVIDRRSTTPLSPPSKPPPNRDPGDPPPTKQKKKFEVKWELPDDDTMKNRPVPSADTESGNTHSAAKRDAGEDATSGPGRTHSPQKNDASKDGKVNAGVAVMTEEEQLREATRVASGFVASLLAQAVADYIEGVHEDNHTGIGQQSVTKAQVDAARLTAAAAVAAHTGEIDTTAQAVMDAAKSLQLRSSERQTIRSKTCVIL